MQIADALTTPALIDMLAAIEPAPITDAPAMGATTIELGDCCAHLEESEQLARLLHLMLLFPPSCHPAILYARYPSVHLHRSLSIPDVYFPAAAMVTDDTCPQHASFLVQILSAAAPLTHGDPNAIWSEQSPEGSGAAPPPRLMPSLPRSAAPEPENKVLALLRPTEVASAPRPSAQHADNACMPGLELLNSNQSEPAAASGGSSGGGAQGGDGVADSSSGRRRRRGTRGGRGRSKRKTAAAGAAPDGARDDSSNASTGRGAGQPAGSGSGGKSPRSCTHGAIVHRVVPLPGNTLTHLRLDVSRWRERKEPWWCYALAQLHTLRAVSIQVEKLEDMRPSRCVHALESLPDLEELHVYGCSWEAERIDDGQLSEVLVAISSLRRLRALSLEGCFYCGHAEPRDMARDIQSLGQLTAVTRLSLRGNALRVPWAKVFADALRHMHGLQDLVAAENEWGESLVWHVCQGGGLSSLRRLDLHGSRRLNAERLAELVTEEQGHALSSLTELNLRGCAVNDEMCEDIADLLSGMPGLCSLNLCMSALSDKGLEELADVLPELQMLTQLNASVNNATGAGIMEVVGGLLDAQAGGGDGIRSLDVSCVCVGPSDGEELAQLLGELKGLEELSVSGMELEKEGVRAIMAAVQDLPKLQDLDVTNNGLTMAHAGEIGPLFRAVTHLRRFRHHQILHNLRDA